MTRVTAQKALTDVYDFHDRVQGIGELSVDRSLTPEEERQLRYELLGSGSEDVCGLWEAEWTISAFPHVPQNLRRDVARRLLRELLIAGYIELVEHHPGEYTRTGPTGPLVELRPVNNIPLDRDAAKRALDDPDHWRPGGKYDDAFVGFVCTEEGEHEFGREAAHGMRLRHL